MTPATQRSGIHAVAKFSHYFGRSPDRLGLEDVRAFQVHLVSTGVSGRRGAATRSTEARSVQGLHDLRAERD